MTTRIFAVACVIAAALLFSCNTKKNPVPSKGQASTNNDAASITSVSVPEDPGIESYNRDYMQNVAQQFRIQSDQVTEIIGKKGLKITVDPKALEKEDGSPAKGIIKVELIELTNTDDLFRGNAATVCDGRLLASGGSYFIGMDCEGSKLRLKKGRTMPVQFPVLKKQQMELFYGERDGNDNMNWKSAGMPLRVETVDFRDNYDFYANYQAPKYIEMKEPTRYKSMQDEVYYYDKKITLKDLIDTLNKNSYKVYVDRTYNWPHVEDNIKVRDTNFLLRNYGPMYLLTLKTYRARPEEDSINAINQRVRDSASRAFRSNSLAGQIQNYYAPSNVKNLGWLNCDYFYRDENKTEVELDIPITYNNSRVQYFLIFNSFNGLLNEQAQCSDSRVVINALPVGTSITLVAFIKKNGVIYHSKEEFIVERNKKIPVHFEEISKEELAKIFRNNIKA